MAESDTTFLTPVTPYTSQLQGPNIRLLRLAPGEREAPIACSLVDASLDSLPPYEALSYVWGDPTITEPIMCNGLPGRITINLARALRRIRAGISLPSAMRNDFTSNECLTSNSEDPSYFPKLLWVDALCIDQDNTHERNIQVPLMRDIFIGNESDCLAGRCGDFGRAYIDRRYDNESSQRRYRCHLQARSNWVYLEGQWRSGDHCLARIAPPRSWGAEHLASGGCSLLKCMVYQSMVCTGDHSRSRHRDAL